MGGMNVQAREPEFLRTDEAGRRLSVTAKTIRAWVDMRILPAYRPTRRTILIRVSDIEKAMARFRVGG
jgi:excisionase family DNA binding protein